MEQGPQDTSLRSRLLQPGTVVNMKQRLYGNSRLSAQAPRRLHSEWLRHHVGRRYAGMSRSFGPLPTWWLGFAELARLRRAIIII